PSIVTVQCHSYSSTPVSISLCRYRPPPALPSFPTRRSSDLRVELAAAAMTASDAVWHWRQITGPEVELEPRENCLDFIAPDVDEPTSLRIAVYAASEDGRNRSDWRYFDLTIQPSMLRVRGEDDADFSPATPLYVG